MSENTDDTDPDDFDTDALELETVTRNEGWGPEAFRDAGEATFGSRTREDD